MSAWSSAASGKGSALSYAERLRRAKEDSSRSSADSSALPRASSSSAAPTLTQLSSPPAPAPPKPAPSGSGAWKVVTASKSANGRADPSSSASASSTTTAHAVHSAPAPASSAAAPVLTSSTGASQAKASVQWPTAPGGAARPAAVAPRPQPAPAAPGVNVWEQRRKQLADKSVESRHDSPVAPAAGSKAQAEQKKPVSVAAPPATATPSTGASAPASSSASAGAKAAVVAQSPAPARSGASGAHDAPRPAAAVTTASSSREGDAPKEQRSAPPAASGLASTQAEASSAKAAERRSSGDASQQGDSPMTRSIAESTLPFVPRSPLSLARAPTGPAYDNAWLDRIHLLNGGQNMPTFVPALQESSGEMGIGAGLQPAPAVSMPPSLPSTAEEPPVAATPTSAETHRAWQKTSANADGAAGDALQNGLAALDVASGVDTAEIAAASDPASAAPASSSVAESSARRRAESTSSGSAARPAAPAAASKSKTKRAQAAASVLADSESWPSPLDATFKSAARKPRVEPDGAGENASGERPAATEKGLEGLDVQVAKGAGDKGKKGKQWIAIVPTITHASPLPVSGRKTGAKDTASKEGSSTATSPHPKKTAKARSDKGASSGEKRFEPAQHDKRDVKSSDKENGKSSASASDAPSAAPDSLSSPRHSKAREAQMPPPPAPASLAEAVSASPAPNGDADAAAPVAPPFAQPLMHMALSELPAMFPPMRWTSGSPGPPSPFPFVPPPQRLNKDGSFSPTRAADFLAPNGDPSWHPSHSPVRNSARGRGSRGRGRGGRHGSGDVFSGSRTDGAFLPGPGAESDLDSQGAPSTRGSPGSGSYAAGAQLPFWLHGGQAHTLPVFQPQGMAPASLAQGDWQQQQPSPARGPGFVSSPAGSPRAPGLDAPTHQLLKQIEFYFSERNLQGDFFLRQCMDAHGWVSISTVAGFNRVQRLTSDLALVRDTLMYSSVLEVDASNMRVRKAQNWEPFVLGANGVPNGVDQASRPSSAQAGVPEQYYGALAHDDVSRRHAGLSQLRRQDSAASESVEGSGVNGYAGESSNTDGRSTTTVLTEASRSKSSTAFSSPPSSAAHQDSSMEDGDSDSDKEDQETLGVVAAEGLGGTLFPPVSNGA